MKKTLLLIVACVTVLCSCKGDESLDSLEGTYWKSTYSVDGFVYVEEMVFTSSTATYIYYVNDFDHYWSFSGRYIFDPHKQEFVMPNEETQPEDTESEWTIPDLKGTIKDGVMTFAIFETFDEARIVELKKQ